MSEPQTLDPPTPAETPPAPASPLRKILIAVGCGLIAVAIAYGVGRAQGLAEVKRVREAAETEKRKLEAHARELTHATEASQKRLGLLEARRSLSQALLALEGRNFGVAGKRLKRAAESMSGMTDNAALKQLADTLSSYKLVATEDLGQQRDQLVAWMNTFDEQLPPQQ